MRKSTDFAIRRLFPWSLLFVLFAQLAALPASAGGWATFMLIQLPESPRAGEAIDLTFVARAHGKTPFHFTKGEAAYIFRHVPTGQTIRAEATPSIKYSGTHTASVVLPRVGEWTWELHPGGYPVLKLQPLTVFPRAEEALITRGKALFAAKGCTTCHRNDNVNEQWTVEIGPDLTSYNNSPVALATWLANPSAVKSGATMPVLGLQREEIDALVAFLLAEAPATAQR